MVLDKEVLLENVKSKLKYDVLNMTYELAINPLKIAIYDDNKIVLVTPSISQTSFIQNNCFNTIKDAFESFTNKKHDIQIIEQDNLDTFLEDYRKQHSKEAIKPNSLNPNFTFDTFVVGSNNQLAAAMAKAVSENPSVIYNPLFIYGGPGLGKTHLMQAVANNILKTRPTTRILYVSSEKFLNDLVTSIKNLSKDTEEFRHKYRNVDVFIMDDVQFLSGKQSAQQELFNTFNELHANNKQIILSADQPPKDIPVLEDRLKSRFSQGLIVDISKPDFETRLAILKKKAEDKNIIIDDHILSLIAEKIDSNIRELEGALNKLVVISSFTNVPITIENTEKALNDFFLEKENIITPDTIIEVVCNYYSVDKKDLKSSKKSKDIVVPRQIAMYLCRTELGLPYKKVGEIFGKKDHTTIMHAESKIIKAMKEDKNTKLIVESVENILRTKNEINQ